jgi:23S rRNA (adenine2503-C2)-methyltransferase
MYSLTSKDWLPLLEAMQEPATVLPFLMAGLYRDRELLSRHLSEKLHQKLEEDFCWKLPAIAAAQEATDGTVKFQVRLRDGLEVETVLIPFYKRFTVCLSTQVGCGMNCSFCFTGTQGLKRQLSADEILGQYLAARDWLRARRPDALNPSVVFMGQGEPLHNPHEVQKAIELLMDPLIAGVGHRQMTLSTVGYLPNLPLLREFPRVNIALSLHSPFDSERSQLIPVNERYPLSAVMAELDKVPLLPRQFITFEYLMIKGLNMSRAHADALRDLLGQRRALLNLIPFNPFPGSRWERPSDADVEAFKSELVDRRLRVMVRRTKGSDILAACGQLKIERLGRKHAP